MKLYEYVAHDERLPYLDSCNEFDAEYEEPKLFGEGYFKLSDGRTVDVSAVGKCVVDGDGKRYSVMMLIGNREREAIDIMTKRRRQIHGKD